MRGLLLLGALGAVVCAAAAAAPPARATSGVAIDLGRIEIAQALTPGGSYRLPTIGVRNPGTEVTHYRLRAGPVESGDAKAPPQGWFTFEPAQLTLEPGETRAVRARITLPPGSDPGDYIALVGAEIVADGGGARVGAAAATRLTFTVEPANALQAWWLRITRLFGDHAPWSYVAPLLAALAVLLRQLRGRFTFRVERRAE